MVIKLSIMALYLLITGCLMSSSSCLQCACGWCGPLPGSCSGIHWCKSSLGFGICPVVICPISLCSAVQYTCKIGLFREFVLLSWLLMMLLFCPCFSFSIFYGSISFVRMRHWDILACASLTIGHYFQYRYHISPHHIPQSSQCDIHLYSSSCFESCTFLVYPRKKWGVSNKGSQTKTEVKWWRKNKKYTRITNNPSCNVPSDGVRRQRQRLR